mmetsp:Transcript_25546/g.64878  ORF Transcript_25546/g.64878 Transcript_25546/m.64878 type:complete len:219 (+) Transcript_25546:318-974(+)
MLWTSSTLRIRPASRRKPRRPCCSSRSRTFCRSRGSSVRWGGASRPPLRKWHHCCWSSTADFTSLVPMMVRLFGKSAMALWTSSSVSSSPSWPTRRCALHCSGCQPRSWQKSLRRRICWSTARTPFTTSSRVACRSRGRATKALPPLARWRAASAPTRLPRAARPSQRTKPRAWSAPRTTEPTCSGIACAGRTSVRGSLRRPWLQVIDYLVQSWRCMP